MHIEQLKDFDARQLEEIRCLMQALSDHCTLSESQLKETIGHSLLYVLKDKERTVGMATLCLYHTPSGCKGCIEDVVILPEYQGKGLGKQLLQHVLDEAKLHAPLTIYLFPTISQDKRKVREANYIFYLELICICFVFSFIFCSWLLHLIMLMTIPNTINIYTFTPQSLE